MKRAEVSRLETILAKVEQLQNATRDTAAKDRLGRAKDELLALWRNRGTPMNVYDPLESFFDYPQRKRGICGSLRSLVMS